METKNAVSKRWDDLVFENRNKEYGAYSIRKTYSENVNKGFMMSLGTALLFFIIPFIASSFKTIEPIIPGGDLPPTKFGPPPIIEPIKQKQVDPPPVRKKIDGNQFVVTDQPVDPAEIDKIDIHNPPSDGDENITGNNNLTFNDGPGTGVIEGPPVVVEPPKPVESTIVIGLNATYKGGMEAMSRFLGRHLRYPPTARRIGVDGTVYVSFVVDTDGKVINATIIKGVSKECDEEALRVVSLMTDWIPAQQNNRKVMVRMVLPIKFLLEVN
jgi:protein TonB